MNPSHIHSKFVWTHLTFTQNLYESIPLLLIDRPLSWNPIKALPTDRERVSFRLWTFGCSCNKSVISNQAGGWKWQGCKYLRAVYQLGEGEGREGGLAQFNSIWQLLSGDITKVHKSAADLHEQTNRRLESKTLKRGNFCCIRICLLATICIEETWKKPGNNLHRGNREKKSGSNFIEEAIKT